MKAKSFFAVLGIFAFLFVVGCSSSVDNPTANNNQGSIDIAGKGSSASKVGCPGQCTASTKASTNQFDGGDAATIYYNFPLGGGSTQTRWYTIDCKVASDVGCTQADLSWCGSLDANYYTFDFTVPGTTDGDRCTLTLWNDSSCTVNIGNNSWIDPKGSVSCAI